ncbi:MAG: hypothetical protein ACKV19_19180 [Verrucomicrobiales bacterium]
MIRNDSSRVSLAESTLRAMRSRILAFGWPAGRLLAEAAVAREFRLWRSVRYELEFWLAALHRDHDRQTRSARVQTAESHAEILTCLRTGTSVQAERLMRDHILGWREWLPLKENHHPTPLPASRHFASA